MTKKLRPYWLYVASGIKGKKQGGRDIVIDEWTNENLDPWDVDDKIKIYERQVKEWFLKRATYLLRGNNYGLIVLMVCLSYLEGVEQYRKGRSSRPNHESKKFFRESLQRLYPGQFTEPQLNVFYDQARCGLFHNGMTEGMIVYSYDYPHPLDFSELGTIKVNPKILLKDIKKDFRKYLRELYTNQNLRNNFNDMFSVT
ncbi:MAG: hypothetical protein JW840_02540 [Candidatus Thermoplasmatota archaeon]|nr:hypothetical protein [Candidatus Thermoplasmatota archaeon]